MKCPTWSCAARLIASVVMLWVAAPAAVAPAPAPEIDGSSYSLYLNSAPGVTLVPDVRFDGVDENFSRTVTLADGQQAQVGFSVHEEQVALGNGEWMIRIVIDGDADLFPTGELVGVCFRHAARRPAGPGRRLAPGIQRGHGLRRCRRTGVRRLVVRG